MLAAALVIVPGGPADPAARAADSSATPSAGAPAEQAEKASVQARRTGRPVPVAALTTPTSTTTATPRGTFVVTQTVQPTRVKRGRSWVKLDRRLHRGADGSLVPNATSSDLVISGGGSGPLASMRDGGISLSFTWPTTLPAPVVHGPSATYANVLPGVDLVVTATEQGGFSHVLVVKTRVAAANPKLAHLAMRTHGNGLSVSADTQGDLRAGTGPSAQPVFAAEPPVMWDSTTKGRPTASPNGSTAEKPPTLVPDLPDAFGVAEPAKTAHITKVKTTVTPAPALAPNRAGPEGDATVTLTPDAGLLDSPSTVFPVYIDPTWSPLHAGGSRQAWASVSNAIPSTTKYKNSFDPNANVLQSGHVDGFTARSFIRFGVSSALKGATIYSSDVKFTTDNDGDEFCHASTETDLWWTGDISTSTSWNNQPTWHSKIDGASATNCPNHAVDFSATSFMQDHAASGISSITFGIRAANESDESFWEEFYSASGEASMSTEYDHPPALGRIPATSPGGSCQTGNPATVVVGNDDVTFSIVPNDPDGGQLGTEFVIKNYGGSTVFDSGNPDTGGVATISGTAAKLIIKRATIQGWHTDGATTAYPYSWYVVTSDGKLHSPSSGAGTSGSPCNFTYDPTGPTQPGLQAPTGTLTLGQQANITLAPCADALANPPGTCTGTAPARYVYQVNEVPPLSVTATGTVQTVTIPLHHVGPNVITAYGLSAGGNPGPIASDTYTVDAPATPYTDGDVDGDANPDYLTNTAPSTTGLLLATSDGRGNLNTALNIGTLGTSASTGSPTDWNGARILHGDFTQNRVQDIAAYYPADGSAALLFGNGDTSVLNPSVGTQQQIAPAGLANDNGDNPVQLTAAGNASLTTNPIPDLIGIAGNATNGYELDLYTSPDGLFGDYTYTQPLAALNQTPDGTSWGNYTIAAAQPAGHTILLALNTTTGALYESANPNQDPTTLVGTPISTWTQFTWTPPTNPALISADINPGGQLEIWTQTSSGTTTTATAFTLSGTTLTAEAAGSLLAPGHEWPLTASTGPTSSCSASVCTPDTGGGTDASATGGVTFTPESVHGTVADLDGTGYLALPDNLVHSSSTLSITLSFRADPGTNGIVFSTGSNTPENANPTATPIMYIGTDGRLYTQFQTGIIRPMISPQPVNDGQWHTVTLNTNGVTEDFLLADNQRIGMAGHPTVTNTDPKNYLGAGVFPADTPTAKWINAPGDTTRNRASYFTGQISDFVYYKRFLSPKEVAVYNTPKDVTGPITSQISSALCVTDDSNSTANGTKIMIWTCDNREAEQWTIKPAADNVFANNITIHGKCLTVSGGGTTAGTPIVLSDCTGNTSQKWNYLSIGQLWNPLSDKCLDDPNATTQIGTQLQIWTCNLTDAQNWHLP